LRRDPKKPAIDANTDKEATAVLCEFTPQQLYLVNAGNPRLIQDVLGAFKKR
jgi:hypothetical protein